MSAGNNYVPIGVNMMGTKLADARIDPPLPQAGPAVSDSGSSVAYRHASRTLIPCGIHVRRMVGRWAALILACACGWLGAVQVRGETVATPTEVRTFHQFYTLSPELAQKGAPVLLRGVVLCYDSDW